MDAAEDGVPGTTDAASVDNSASAAAEESEEPELDSGLLDERCVQEIVYSLLDAKGRKHSTGSVQAAINMSVVQIARANFILVITSIFSYLEKRKCTEQHELSLLQTLIQVLVMRRSDDSQVTGDIDKGTIHSLTQHLVQELSGLSHSDPRQQHVSHVLVELAPMQPEVVLNGLLGELDKCSTEPAPPAKDSSSSPGPAAAVQQSAAYPAIVKILREIALHAPKVLNGKLHEVMGRYLPLLQSCKLPAMKVILYRGWSALCVALVNCTGLAVNASAEPLQFSDASFSRRFAFTALKLRRRDLFRSGDTGPESACRALSEAFTVSMSFKLNQKDQPQVCYGALEALGHFSVIIDKNLFLQNADALFEFFRFWVKERAENNIKILARGLCLFLQGCIDVDKEILTLDKGLDQLLPELFKSVVGIGPLLSILHADNTESVQSQAEVLHCFDVLTESFEKQILDFLLQKVKGTRDDKLGALLVLKHLVKSQAQGDEEEESSGRMIQRDRVLAGVQPLINEPDPAISILLCELVLAFAGADYLAQSIESRAQKKADESLPHAKNLLKFLLNATIVTEAVVQQQQTSFSLVTKKYTPSDGPGWQQVREHADLVISQLAEGITKRVRPVLWPMILQYMLLPSMRAGLPVLCRAVAQILLKAKEEPDYAESTQKELAAALTKSKAANPDVTNPEALLTWLLLCAHDPYQVSGLGLSILRCLEALSPFIHTVLGQIWKAPSVRLQTLCTKLEDHSKLDSKASNFDVDFWFSALSEEVHFFLSALPEHDDLPSRLVDILQTLHKEAWKKEANAGGLSDAQRSALFNLFGVCLSHVNMPAKVQSTLDFVITNSAESLSERSARRACAKGVGFVAQKHFDLILTTLSKASKTDAAQRKTGTFGSSWFGKSLAVQQAEQLRAMLALALGFCVVYAPNREQLQEQVRERILGPLHTMLTQEKTLLVLQSVVEAVKLANDAIRTSPETSPERDPFLAQGESKAETTLGQDPSLRASLGLQRDELVRALLPFLETPHDQEEEDKKTQYEELICPALDAMGSLISLPLDLPSDLYASILEAGLQVLIFSIPSAPPARRAKAAETQEEMYQNVDPVVLQRIDAVTRLIKSLLFHAHSWLGVSRLLQAVHAAGANCPVEFIRLTCTQLLCVLCTAAPILDTPDDKSDDQQEVGDWCECLALLLPRTGDSCRPVVVVSVEAVQQLLSRCEWTADVRIGEGIELLDDKDVPSGRSSRHAPPREKEDLPDPGEGSGPTPPSQQLVGALVDRLPARAIPPLVQHLMPAMHDSDKHAALSGVDALYLILQACSEKLTGERATNLISTVFEEVEKVSHSSVRQRVLSCIKVLAQHHFESAIGELLDTYDQVQMSLPSSIMGALQVLAKENKLLLKLLNYLTDTLNNSDPGTVKRPNRLVQAATMALGHLFSVKDSSIGTVAKKYFPQLFGTFLLRVGTTHEGMSTMQTAISFQNFLQASHNDSMSMALDQDALMNMTSTTYDEVICELAAVYCRCHPDKREALFAFIHPFITRPFAGHRVACVATLSQLLASGGDQGLKDTVVFEISKKLLESVQDKESDKVRKQGHRGMAHLIMLWQQKICQGLRSQVEVLPPLCVVLKQQDEPAMVQKEAAIALQRACQVPNITPAWREQLLKCVDQLQPIVDAAENSLRVAAFDLMGRLCTLAVHVPTLDDDTTEEGALPAGTLQGCDAQILTSASLAEAPPAPGVPQDFVDCTEKLLICCVIRLEDDSPAVSSAASRCLDKVAHAICASATEAAKVADLLQRREREELQFEDFIFPFIEIMHRDNNPALATERLQMCQDYFRIESISGSIQQAAESADAETNGKPVTVRKLVGQSFGLSTCVAAGFTSAALVSSIKDPAQRPAALMRHVCSSLMELLRVEDSDFRARIARILGFYHILSIPDRSK